MTGAGVVTALGAGWAVNAAGFRAGRTAFGPVTLFDCARQRVNQAAVADVPDVPPPGLALATRAWARIDRGGRFLLAAAAEAWQQAGWQRGSDVAVVLGTTSGGMRHGQDFYRDAARGAARRRGQPTRVVHYQAERQALDVCDAFAIPGPALLIANACASGASAIGQAWETLRQGRAQRILAGAFEGLNHLVYAGFDSLQALSPTRCRPFDAARDGLVLGEGAAVLALETLSAARRRGAEILGEVAGYGASNDVYHLTQPEPQGAAAFAAMTAACAAARVAPDEVDYVNAHGTGTVLNDQAEALAINRWAGQHAANLPVSSTKAGIGHLLGAAGAVEAVVCLMALNGQWLPPETPIETPDPVCAFPVINRPRDAVVRVALSNSFGFGGSNATLVLRRWI